jgi:tetratricopeptide (TPR) repeat protein
VTLTTSTTTATIDWMLDPEVEETNVQASLLMTRGIALMDQPEREAAEEALRCFDEALAMRRTLPYQDVPLLRFGLAACLLNRADALARLATGDTLDTLLDAYDESIDVARELPMGEDPRYPRRLAIAHQNRGLALQQHGRAEAAIAAFSGALAVLDREESAAISDLAQLQGAVLMNRANARLAYGDPDGVEDAIRAATLVADSEASDLTAASVGLGARHLLCRVAAGRMPAPGPDGSTPETIHELTDTIDGGLALVRAWEQAGESRFRPLAQDLFRFGARVYAIYQPQFLEEFIAEQVDPAQSSQAFVESDEIQSAASEALAVVRELLKNTEA